MKHIIGILTLAAALFAVSVQHAEAQITRYSVIPLIGDSGGTYTNNVLASATNTYSSIMADVSNQDNVAIQVHGFPIVSNFCKLRLDFMASVDGSTWISTNFISVSCLGGLSTNDLSAGIFCYTTNVDVRGLRGLKLFRVANTDSHGIATNLQVNYGIKR
jgi:hypothetical protein